MSNRRWKRRSRLAGLRRGWTLIVWELGLLALVMVALILAPTPPTPPEVGQMVKWALRWIVGR